MLIEKKVGNNNVNIIYIYIYKLFISTCIFYIQILIYLHIWASPMAHQKVSACSVGDTSMIPGVGRSLEKCAFPLILACKIHG